MKNKSIVSRIVASCVKHPVTTLSCVTTGLLLAGVCLYTTPYKYESVAVIKYEDQGADITLVTPFSSGKTAITEEITAPAFITAAITDKVDPVTCYVSQDFQTQVNNYAFPYTIKHTVTGPQFKDQSYIIEELNQNTFQLTSSIHGITRTKIGKFDEEIADQNLMLIISRKKSAPYLAKEIIQPAKYSFKVQSEKIIAAQLASNSNDINASENNGIVTIRSRNENPAKAEQITSAITNHFLATRNSGIDPKAESLALFEARLDSMTKQLEATEAQISEYKRANNITEISYDTEKNLDILKNLQLQKSQLELSLVALNNTSKYLRKNRELNNSNVDYGTISDPVFSEQIAQLNTKYAAKESGQGTATTDAEIEALKVSIAERIRNTRKKTTIQINKISQEIAQLNQLLSAVPEKANMLSTLNRQLELDKKVYDLLAEKRAQALITGSGISTNGKILKPATRPTTPVSPNAWLVLLSGLLAGLFTAIPFALLADKIQSRKIAGRKELDKQTQLPYIGSIAQYKSAVNASDTSISYLCTRVLMRQDAKFVTFASNKKGEGKTFIATHFAQAFAAMDKKVLVIDMNAVNPEVAGHFNVTPERNLADVLEGKCDIHDAISITSYPNLDVLECGNLSSGVNSLLASKKRTAIFESLKNHYDLIVADTPDLASQIDAIPMMKMGDLNLFVVNANTSRMESLVMAEQINKDYELDNMFLLINSVKQKQTPKSGSNQSGKVRKLKTSNQTQEEKAPSMLRRIALWFY